MAIFFQRRAWQKVHEKGHIGITIIGSQHPAAIFSTPLDAAVQAETLGITECFRIFITPSYRIILVSLKATIQITGSFLIQVGCCQHGSNAYIRTIILMGQVEFLLIKTGIIEIAAICSAIEIGTKSMLSLSGVNTGIQARLFIGPHVD